MDPGSAPVLILLKEGQRTNQDVACKDPLPIGGHLGAPIYTRRCPTGTSAADSRKRWRTSAKPEIFNTDQGSQFTSAVFTGVLSRADMLILRRTVVMLCCSIPY